MKRSLLTLLTLMILAAPALADVPKTMNIQGVLTDPAGNPVADDDYNVNFLFYDSEFATSDLFTNDWDIPVVDGLFSHVLDMTSWLDLGYFADELWLGIAISGEAEQTPRIRLTSVPYAFRAAIADSVVGGGGGGSDTDWEIVGDDIYHLQGRVYIGIDAPGAKAGSDTAEDPRDGGRIPSSSKLEVESLDQTAVYGKMTDTDGLEDQRAGLYGFRHRDSRNDGTGFGSNDVSGGVLGYNSWGDSYTFGVAGHSWLDYEHSAGVLGADNSGTTWGALAYRDASTLWGLYTPVNAHVGGNLHLSAGAAAGYILTSDASGFASWQPPGAANSDSDWTISGDDLIHEAPGVVAIGTASPSPVVTSGHSTLQISAGLWPGIALDRTSSSFNRWALFQEGVTGDFIIGHAGTEGYAPTPQLIMDEDGRVSLGTGTGTSARLAIHGGNGDVDATPGDFLISSNGNASFRVGVHGTGAEAGEVNLRAKTTDDTGRLDIGVDDHDVMVVADYRVSFPNATGTNMVLIESMDSMGDSGGNIKLRSPNSSAPLITIDASPNGDGVIDMNQGEINGIYLDSKGNTYGGGEIKLYNGSGVETLKLDAHHSASGQSRITTASLEITGGADLSEQFNVGEDGDQAEPGMVLSIDPKRPGRLAMSDRAYDRRVAGVVSGAGGVNTGMLMGQRGSEADGELPVALAGRVYVWADASEGPIEPGDLLTTADRPGHAMRVKDHQRAGGAILGKAMTGLSEGRGLVLVLVSLQ